MSTQLIESPQLSDPALQDESIFSHVIDRGDDERTVQAIVMEARVMGITLTALCGHKFIPSRNPESHPICPKCEEMLAFAAQFTDDQRPIRGS